jgi:P27 family predicted phage terminase small subunit
MGRKRKPIERQIVEGDPRQRGKRKLEQKLAAQVKATPGLPSCPRHLKGRARYAWTFWAEELVSLKQDKRPDAQMLEGACTSYALAVQADLILAKDGPIIAELYVEPETKEVIVLSRKKHPAVEIRNRAWGLVRSFCSEFGFSPVSRLRLSPVESDPGGDEDDLIKKLSQPRPSSQVESTFIQ